MLPQIKLIIENCTVLHIITIYLYAIKYGRRSPKVLKPTLKCSQL